jgi:hypothetical protein
VRQGLDSAVYKETKTQIQQNKKQIQGDFSVPTLDHPSDEDLSLHPSEQKSLAGDPESLGTPKPQKKRGRMGHPKLFEQMQQVSLRYAEIAS